MLKDLNQLIEKVIEFCQERTDVLMIGGVAIIVLVVLISVIRSIGKQDDEDDLDFDEDLFLKNTTEEKTETAKETPAVEKCKQKVIFPEELAEELSKVSSNNLQEVEIKIQSAELKFRYGNPKSEGETFREEVKIFGEESPCGESEEQQSEAIPGEEQVKELQPELGATDIEELQDKLKVEAPVKFGAGNYNISKSGKVFTEEELEIQIRD